MSNLVLRNRDSLPAYLKNQEVVGMDEVVTNVSSDRIKIIESMTDRELKQEHGEGSVVLSQSNQKIVGAGDPFIVVPLFHWISFEKWSDVNDQASQTVLESTTDRASELARRAETPSLRKEGYGPLNENGVHKFSYSYVKSLNYLIEFQDGPFAGEVAMMSYSKGNYRLGTAFNSFLKRRGTSIFNNRVALSSQVQSNGVNEWYGLEFEDPQDGRYVSEEDSVRLKSLHDKASDAMKRMSDQ